jgi:glycosyltransferase involved in cell wall biosynthesis
MDNVWIVIPAHNEEKKITDVITGLRKSGYSNTIVVDDGSEDQTYQKALSTNTVVLRHIINRGQGAALQTGIDYALNQEAEIIITFDSDGQHQPEDISKLIKPIQEGEADVVLGSRFLSKNSNTPFIRKMFLKGGALIFRILYGIKLTDSHNGLRALSRKTAKKIKITQDGMEHASEIVEKIAKYGLKYKEMPVTINYTDYSLRHGQRTSDAFKILFKMILNKITK